MSSPIVVSPTTHPTLTLTDRILLNLLDSEINAISGAAAGVISALAVCPLDVAKTKLQAQGGLLSLQKHYEQLGSDKHSKLLLNHSQVSPSVQQSSSPSVTISSATASKLTNTPIPPNGTFKLPTTHKYKGIFGTLSTIVKEEGIAGLYRGLVPITIGYLPTWAIYFVVYEEVKNRTSSKIPEYPFLSNVVSALTAGTSSTLLTNPIWVIKTRLMTQSADHFKYNGTIDCFRKMFAEEGIRSFYSGLAPALLGLLHVAVQFPLYEKLKKAFNVNDDIPKLHQIPQIIASSVLSKICASTITYPHEVVRTRIQIQPTIMEEHPPNQGTGTNGSKKISPFKRRNTSMMKYHGIINTTRTVFLEEGWKAFYSGLGTNMVRTVPASALTLLSYEVIASSIRDRRHKVLVELNMSEHDHNQNQDDIKFSP